MKQAVAIVLSVFLVFCLAACGGGGASTASISSEAPAASGTASAASSEASAAPSEATAKEPANFTLFGRTDANKGDWSKMWLFGQIEEALNVTFTINMVSSEAYEEKKNLAFASNALPDCFTEGLSNVDLATYGGQGMLLALNELIDSHAPDVTAFFREMPEAKKAMTFPDGNIYTLQGINTYPRELSKYRFWVNTKWAETLNVKVPATLDEFYDYLKAIQEGDPNGNGDSSDEIPMTARYATGSAWNNHIPILAALGFTADGLEAKDGKVRFVPAEPLYKEFIAYMNRLYADGLLDREMFTQTEDQRQAKIAEGRVGVFGDNANWTIMPEKELWSQYEGIEPMTSEHNGTKMWPAHDVRLLRQFTITSACKDPERLMEVGNWFYTREGTIASNSGVENGKWEGGEGGYEWTTNEDGLECFRLHVPEQFTSFNNFREQVITPHAFPYLDTPSTPQVQWITGLDERQVSLTKNITVCEPYYVVGWSDNIKLTPEEANEANLILTEINNFKDQMYAKMVIGEMAVDAEFDSYVTGMKDRGLDRYVEIYQAVYDRWANS